MYQFISTIYRKLTDWLAFLLSLLFILTRLFPYLKSCVPLGYDPGLYLYLFKQYQQIPFFSYASLSDWLVSGYPPGLPIFVKLLLHPGGVKLNLEKFLVPLIVFFSILLFFSVYFLAKKLWDKKVALWTVFIFTCSTLQFRAYWYYYLKNLAALSFLLFTFYFLLRPSYLAIPLALLTIHTHRPTAALLLITLLVSLIIQKKQRRYYGIVLGSTLTAATFYYLPTFDKTVLPLIRPILKSFVPQSLGGIMGMPSGTFYNPLQALALSLLYLPFALYGFKKEGLKKKNLLITAPFLVSLCVVVFRLFFNQRVIIFTDLFLIFFAGAGLANFSPRRYKFILAGAYIGLLIVFISIFIYKTGQPLIYPDEFREIKMLAETEKQAYVLVTDQEYTPWIYGWSNRKPITPGFGEHDIYWSIPEWHQFWESGDRKIEHNLLLKLPKPLYIYHGDHTAQILTDFSGECFERINWRTYKFICEKLK